MKTVSKPYQASDAIFKIMQFKAEIKDLKAAYKSKLDSGQMTDVDIKEMAADIVRSEQPTYSKTSLAMKKLSRAPLFGSFVMFQSQMWKTRGALVNNISKFH